MNDDSVPHQPIVELFAHDRVITDEELQRIIRDRSRYDLALLAVAFHEEALAVTIDPDRTHVLTLQLIDTINRLLPPTDRLDFESSLAEVMEGHTAQSADVIELLPTFRYVPRGDALTMYVDFPGEGGA